MNREPTHAHAPAALRAAPEVIGKVAAVTVSFWIVKVLVTTVGDLSGDALSISLGLGYGLALVIALALFLTLLFAQIRARRFTPWLYWAVLFSSSPVGAEISDSLDRALHWGDLVGTLALLGVLLAILAVWFARRGALGSYPVREGADERYYWLAALAANSLGSAFGDLVGGRLELGLLGGIAANVLVLALLLGLHRTRRASKALLFWGAFVVSRIPF